MRAQIQMELVDGRVIRSNKHDIDDWESAVQSLHDFVKGNNSVHLATSNGTVITNTSQIRMVRLVPDPDGDPDMTAQEQRIDRLVEIGKKAIRPDEVKAPPHGLVGAVLWAILDSEEGRAELLGALQQPRQLTLDDYGEDSR